MVGANSRNERVLDRAVFSGFRRERGMSLKVVADTNPRGGIEARMARAELLRRKGWKDEARRLEKEAETIFCLATS